MKESEFKHEMFAGNVDLRYKSDNKKVQKGSGRQKSFPVSFFAPKTPDKDIESSGSGRKNLLTEIKIV